MSERLHYIICLGSNTSDKADKISRAIELLKSLCSIISQSDIYEAPDESGLGAPYLNVVLEVMTDLSLDDFRRELKKMEESFGRTQYSKSEGVMPLDADIIIRDGVVTDSYQFSRPYFITGYSQIKSRP